MTLDEIVEHFMHVGEPEPEELSAALGRVGRNPAAVLLADLHAEGLLTPEAAALNVAGVWSACEYPDWYLSHETWRGLFHLAGYTIDGLPGERPTTPVTVYRGATVEWSANWSWTDSRQVAERYASGEWYRRGPGRVWRAVAEPWRLLARENGRNEYEYVVDTTGLTIGEVIPGDG